MTGAMLAAVLALGVSTGWQKLPDGSGYEYIIQLEPQALEYLKQDPQAGVASDLPPGFKGIRSYRIVVGTGTLPQEGNPAEPVLQTSGQAPETLPGGPFPATEPLAGSATAPTASSATESAAESSTETATATKPSESDSPQPWKPLMLAVAGLLASLGGNFYLGWLILETRSRYRTLLHRSHASQPA